MRVFRVADLEPERFEAYLRETLRRSPGRVAHVFNQGLYQWPPDERPETYGAKILAFLARAADWRDGDAERRRRVALAWRATYAQHFESPQSDGIYHHRNKSATACVRRVSGASRRRLAECRSARDAPPSQAATAPWRRPSPRPRAAASPARRPRTSSTAAATSTWA